MEGYGKRVLVGDEDHHAVFFMGSILMGQGHNVVPACNGLMGLNVLSKRRFDVAITVDRMPPLNGGALLKQARVRQSWSSGSGLARCTCIGAGLPSLGFDTQAV
jgi:DNA-binding response OmpR family regulator